jgi:hypothetical protein
MEVVGMFARRRATATVAVLGVVALAVLAACSGDSDPEPPPSSVTTEPAVTAPPALTPEEEAEAEIKATFEDLIAAVDDFYANAGDYSLEEVSTDSPVSAWSVVDEAELELSNWLSTWRLGEVETVGSSTVTDHEIAGLAEDPVSGPRSARSVACRDLSAIEFQTYEGEPATLPYEPNQYQEWTITWSYVPQAEPEAGVVAPGWHVAAFEVATERSC